jgi:hypothetical protein
MSKPAPANCNVDGNCSMIDVVTLRLV